MARWTIGGPGWRRRSGGGWAATLSGCAVVLLALSLGPAPGAPGGLWATGAAPGGSQNGTDVDRLVRRFLAASDEYEQTFRNLTAEEAKTIEVYHESGELDKRRQIISDLVVYHSRRDGGAATTEYRDVRSVDGRVVQRREARALASLTKAAEAEALEDELEAIDRETHRYEFDRHLRGFTIHQSGVLKQWRQAFDLEWVGRDQIAGREVVVLDYRQGAPIPGFRLPVPKEFGDPAPVHRGRLWLDAQTAQLWRDVWELTWPHPATTDPLVMIRRESTYGPSAYGILVPERIVWDWLTHFRHVEQGRPSFALSERTTFRYGVFRRFGVVTAEDVRLPEAADP